MTLSFSAYHRGEPAPYKSTFNSFVSATMTSLFVAWLFLVGIPAGFRVVRRNRYPLGSGMTWSSVERRAWRLRLRSIAWGTCVGLRRVCYLLVAVATIAVVTEHDTHALAGGMVLIVVAVLLALGSARLWEPLFGGVRGWRRDRHLARSTGHLMFGLVLRIGAQGSVVVLAISLLLSLWIESEGGFSSPTVASSGLGETLEAGDAGWMAYYAATLVMIGAAGQSSLLAFIIFGLLVLLLAVDHLGRRFLSPKVQVDRLPAERPQILYLRNFGDDRMRLRSSRMSRRGVLGRFSPWRTRPFEHVVLRYLSTAGYAYAVNPPGSAVYPLGLPKTELPPGTWYDAVRDMARNASCVVVSATPAQLNPGFAWELGMLAHELGHERIMLVVGSRRKRALAESWVRFVAATRQYPLFWGVEHAFQTYATHVMIRVPGVGWEAWGARSRSEWTYAAAISLALERATPLWRPAAP